MIFKNKKEISLYFLKEKMMLLMVADRHLVKAVTNLQKTEQQHCVASRFDGSDQFRTKINNTEKQIQQTK
jgi:hypothetical protein